MFFEDLFLLKNLIADELQPTFTLIAIYMNLFFFLTYFRSRFNVFKMYEIKMQ